MATLALLLGGLNAFGPLSMDMYLAAFPELAQDLDISSAAVQLTLAADVVGLVVGQLIIGPLSDAHGRRRLLVGSTFLCAASSLLCAASWSIGLLLVARFIQGLSGGGGIVLARAVASDVAAGVEAARLFSSFMTVSNVAPIVAPIIGGWLLVWTGAWQSTFVLLAAFSTSLAVATMVWLPETLPPEQRHSGGLRRTLRAFRDLGRDRVFAGYTLAVTLAPRRPAAAPSRSHGAVQRAWSGYNA